MKSRIFAALLAAACPGVAAEAPVQLVLVGDSTVTDKAGWGRAFADRLAPGVTCSNTARGGESSKSCLDSGRWAQAIALRPAHMLIQFGHNDMPGKGPARETDPKTTYSANLARFVDDARAAGARPILVTSIPRRTFKADGKLVGELAPYAEAMRAVAAERKVPLVDLFKVSVEAIERLGPAASEELGPMKDGKRDHTHLARPGMELTADLLVKELIRAVPDMAPLFRRGKAP